MPGVNAVVGDEMGNSLYGSPANRLADANGQRPVQGHRNRQILFFTAYREQFHVA